MPITKASVPLADVEYSYGFGVYESIRVSGGLPYFTDEHCQRLINSAKIIGLEHTYTPALLKQFVQDLLQKVKADTCNLKILLVGGPIPEKANLYIMCLNPLFPDRRFYKTGIHCITQPYERPYPQAKTLNMLPSYLAFRAAKAANAYDSLLINNEGCLVEGTRSNFFVIKGRTIVSPPATDILPGVTRDKVLKVARQNGFKLVAKNIKPTDLYKYDGAFLTSTSAKIMPVRSIDDHVWGAVPPALAELMQTFSQFLETYAARVK